MSYQIRKEQKSKFLAKKNLQFTGLKMKPKLRDHAQFIEVKEIIIVYPSWQEKAMKLQFQVAYRRLFKLVMDVIEDNGSTAGDTKHALNEIQKKKKILRSKYKNKISNEEYRKMWNKVFLLEKKLTEKIVWQQEMTKFIELQLASEKEEKKGRGR